MIAHLKKGSFVIIANAIDKLALFLIPVILTRLLPVEAVGHYSLINSGLVVAVLLVSLSVESYFSIHYFRRSEQERITLFQNCLGLVCLTFSALFVLALFAPSAFIAELPFDRYWLAIILITAGLRSAFNLSMTRLRMGQEVSGFAILKILRSAFEIGAIILFCLTATPSWEWVIYLGLLSYVLFTVLVLIRGKTLPTLKWSELKPLLLYGLSLLPHALAGWAIALLDRFILQSKSGLEDVGVYSAGYSVVLLVSLFSNALNQYIEPIIFKRLANDGEKRSVRTILSKVSLGLLGMSLLFGVVYWFVFPYVFPSRYQGFMTSIPWLVAGYFFEAVYFCFSGLLFYYHRTGVLTFFTVTSAVLNLVLNLILIPQYGILGAAMATFFCLLWSGGLTATFGWRLLSK